MNKRNGFNIRAQSWNSTLARSEEGIGEPAKKRRQYEAEQSRAFEGLLRLHRLRWWHCTVSQYSQPGWPDYVVLGDGWHAFVELKAWDDLKKRRGKLSSAQISYQDDIVLAGGEYRVFVLPDDMVDANLWLRTHTGIVCHIDGLVPS